MIEKARTSPTDDSECDRYSASAPVEYVRARCPALIATLVAIARAATDERGDDDRPTVGCGPATGGPADVAL